MALRLGLTGDVMLGRLVDEAQQTRPPTAVWNDLLDRLQALDGLLVNLECVLSTRGSRWQRTNRPFHFRAGPEWAIPALEAAGVDCCALANNHVLDFEEPALLDTLEHLGDAGIAHAGGGETWNDAFAPATFRLGDDSDGSGAAGLDVAVVSLTDNTPEYAAGEYSPGTAHVQIDVDDPEARSTVQSALGRARAREPDLLVASLHWGPNMVTDPPESFQRFGRWLVDRGVDLVHGHSAHVFQGVEVYDGVPILYDTGDFVDDYAVDRDLRNDRGFLFEAIVESGRSSSDEGGTMEGRGHAVGEDDDGLDDGEAADDEPSITRLRLHPTEIVDRSVRSASGNVAEWCRETMCERSAQFETEFATDDGDLVLAVEE